MQYQSDYVEAWNNRGVALFNLKKLDDAINSLDKAIKLKPDYAESWYNRARVYAKKGVNKKAVSDLKKAVELNHSFKEEAKKEMVFKYLENNQEFMKLFE